MHTGMDQEYKNLSLELDIVYLQNLLRKTQNTVILTERYIKTDQLQKIPKEIESLNELLSEAKDSLFEIKYKFKTKRSSCLMFFKEPPFIGEGGHKLKGTLII